MTCFILDNWSGVKKETLTEEYFTVVVVVVGGTNSRPKIVVIFICLWKDKPFAKKYLTIVVVFGRTKLSPNINSRQTFSCTISGVWKTKLSPNIMFNIFVLF